MLPRVLNLLNRMAHVVNEEYSERFQLANFTPLSDDELTEDDLLLRPPYVRPMA